MNQKEKPQYHEDLHQRGNLADQEPAKALATPMSSNNTTSHRTKMAITMAWMLNGLKTVFSLFICFLLTQFIYDVFFGKITNFIVETETSKRPNGDVGHVTVVYDGKTILTDVIFTLFLYTEQDCYPIAKYWPALKPGESKTFDIGYDLVVGRKKIKIFGEAWKNNLPVRLEGSYKPPKKKPVRYVPGGMPTALGGHGWAVSWQKLECCPGL